MEILAVVLLYALFPLPWALFWLKGRQEWSAEDLVDAGVIGAGVSFCLLYLCAAFRLGLFNFVWAAGLAGALGWSLRRGAASAERLKLKQKPRTPARPEGRLLALVLLGCLALRLLPAYFSEYPHGWDPYFHLVLAKKIMAAGRLISDWTPYETVPLNYPQGSHLLVALLSGLSGAAPHRVFLAGLACFGAASAAQLFSLFSRASGRREVGLYAAAAYAFMAVLGSLDYQRWGGYPNQASMYLYLGLLSLLLTEEPRRRELPAFAALFVGLSLVHHHTMVMAGLTLGWMLLWSAAFGPRKTAARIFCGLAASGLAGAPYFIPYLLRASTLGDTRVFDYLEGVLGPAKLFMDVGPGYFVAAALGLGLWLFKRPRAAVSPLPLQSLALNLALFIALDYGWCWYSKTHLGREQAPFTPGRFLTDSAALLAIFPALLLAELRAALKWSQAAMLAAVAACFAFNYAPYAKFFEPAVAPERLAAYAWLKTHADPDAILIDRAFSASYLSDRLSSDMPIPTSEPQKGSTIRPLVQYVKKNNAKIPPEAGKRQIILVWDGDARAVPASGTIWNGGGGILLVQLNPLPVVKPL